VLNLKTARAVDIHHRRIQQTTTSQKTVVLSAK